MCGRDELDAVDVGKMKCGDLTTDEATVNGAEMMREEVKKVGEDESRRDGWKGTN